MDIWQRWKQTTIANKALVFTGVIVALGTFVSTCVLIAQVCITRENNRRTSDQVEKLIEAANIQANAATKNAAAAASFSTSADGINTQTKLAVDKFDRMAKASENSIKTIQQTARDALQASVDATHLDQRAWVGVTQFIFEEKALHVSLANSGKTPALYVAVGMENEQFCCVDKSGDLGITQGQRPRPIGVMDNKGTLLPGAPLVLRFDVPTINQSLTENQKPDAVRLVRGRIEYEDVFLKPHWTNFCIYERGVGHTSFCPAGNDTDDAPEKYPPGGKKVKYP